MPENICVDQVVLQLLGKIAVLCDTGYLLAAQIRYTRPSLMYRTYPQAWIDYYSEQGYMMSDPVVHWGLTHTGVVLWSELTGQDPEGVVAAAGSYGLNNGWTYATGPSTGRTIASMTKSGADFTAAQQADIIALVDQVHALTVDFDQLPTATQEALRALA
jgi:LuxR family transcriptional regulator, quorum-sensing system regulator SdiA